mmetsp:Transcript_22069/g.30091  ORF Transcript_22069/g.30091 Transcript_22069/m.30091 type:complete len:230 (+) Transcript_22069:639-1328(+)
MAWPEMLTKRQARTKAAVVGLGRHAKEARWCAHAEVVRQSRWAVSRARAPVVLRWSRKSWPAWVVMSAPRQAIATPPGPPAAQPTARATMPTPSLANMRLHAGISMVFGTTRSTEALFPGSALRSATSHAAARTRQCATATPPAAAPSDPRPKNSSRAAAEARATAQPATARRVSGASVTTWPAHTPAPTFLGSPLASSSRVPGTATEAVVTEAGSQGRHAVQADIAAW